PPGEEDLPMNFPRELRTAGSAAHASAFRLCSRFAVLLGLALGILVHADARATSWVHQTLDTPPSGAQGSAIAIDAQGNPRVVFSGPGLSYMRRIGTTWTVEHPDTSAVMYWSALALDANGDPHILYCGTNQGQGFFLKYAHESNGVWQIEPV